jgi:hypothetical protein
MKRALGVMDGAERAVRRLSKKAIDVAQRYHLVELGSGRCYGGKTGTRVVSSPRWLESLIGSCPTGRKYQDLSFVNGVLFDGCRTVHLPALSCFIHLVHVNQPAVQIRAVFAPHEHQTYQAREAHRTCAVRAPWKARTSHKHSEHSPQPSSSSFTHAISRVGEVCPE